MADALVATDSMDQAIHRLRVQIRAVENDLSELKAQLAVAEQSSLNMRKDQSTGASYDTVVQRLGVMQPDQNDSLDLEEYKRYGRQLIMPEVGLDGRLASTPLIYMV